MSSQVSSYYSSIRKYLTVRSLSFLVFVGGVLLALGLALIPHNTYAIDYIKSESVPSSVSLKMGCNTVNSFSGIVAVGPRGSITGADNNPGGCGYYIDSNYQLSWRDGVSGGISFDNTGLKTSSSVSSYLSRSLDNDDYLNKNFRSSVSQIKSSIFSAEFAPVPIQNFSTQYGSELFISAIKWYDGLIYSHLVPQITTGYNTNLDSNQDTIFVKDSYDHTIYTCGSPSKYINDFIYADLDIKLNSDLEDYCYIISYLPQYSYAYELNDIYFSITDWVMEKIDQNLGGFQQFEIGLGNSVGSSTFPKLNYIALSPAYTKNNTYTDNLIENLYSIRYKCLNQECVDQSQDKVNTLYTDHINGMSSYEFSANPAGSWFDVFSGLSVLNPFNIVFQSFTNSQCVNIPIIAGMLSVNNTQYCSWWGGNIRQILTPVFTISSVILLFGFVIHWLRDGDRPIFNSSQFKGGK